MKQITTISLIFLGVLALGVTLAIRLSPPEKNISTYEACPVTQASTPLFVPPEPFNPQAPSFSEFWYGTDSFWTMLNQEGRWPDLPYDPDHGYTQKIAFWAPDYLASSEPQPALTISGRLVDNPAISFETAEATHGSHPDLKTFLLSGVQVPTPGCWEITGTYRKHSLSFVVWIPAATGLPDQE